MPRAKAPSTKKPTTRARRRQWSRMSERTYVAEQLQQLHDDLDGARADGSWQALAALYRQAMAMRARLDEIERAEASAKEDGDSELTLDQVLDAILAELEHLPPAALEQIADRAEAMLSPPAEGTE